MKKYFLIINFIIIFTLINCNSDVKRFFPKTGIVGLRNFLDNLDPTKKHKNSLILQIAQKAYHIKTVLEIHNNKNWIEDSTQFGMKGNGKTFNMLDNKLNKYQVDDARNLPLRRRLYLSLEYDKAKIKTFGMVLNKIIETINTESKNLLQDITNTAIRYASYYFANEFQSLLSRSKELQSLDLEILQSLKDKFDQLAMFRINWNQTVNNIIKDYTNNRNNIQTDKTKIITHINQYYKSHFTAINTIKNLSNDIKDILTRI
ncbi:complement regulator-acquiring protein [Borrelia persica]|uniref:complement regulator-acquiring protein n=1 Tax=Borrelia persica TaxID=44448 RepID=UPI0004649C9D|nr:complement regulator-acquiring protein [Borrelia persica]